MTTRLFVYGTLAPGQPNAHWLSDLEGSWQAASVNGVLEHIGWGADMGYPGLHLDDTAPAVPGMLFTSQQLSDHWPALDDFEGSAYRRVLAVVTNEQGMQLDAYVYALANG